MKKRCWPNLYSMAIWLFLASLMSVTCGFAEEDSIVRWIDVTELEAVLKDQKPLIVDLRTSAEYRGGRLEGALNIPVEVLLRGPQMLDAHKDKPILLYCRTVKKTRRAMRLLQDRGFKTIYALRGGYEEIKLHRSVIIWRGVE